MRGKRSRLGALTFLAALGILLVTSLAAAEEVTRESYREAVEPICKANTRANEKILKGVRKQVRNGKLKAASKRFARASGALKGTYRQLKAVPQPSADEARLAKWLTYINKEVRLFQMTAKKLKAGNGNGATTMQIRLEHTANQANNLVLPFEFHYCQVEPSRFT